MEVTPERLPPQLVKVPCGSLAINFGKEEYSASYPPKAPCIFFLGKINDEMKPICTQGNGRSFKIRDDVFYLFEKTQWKDAHGRIAKETPNSIALATDPNANPLANIAVPRNRGMFPFLPLTKREEEFEEKHASRVILRMPGGVCKSSPRAVEGYIWYEKHTRTCHAGDQSRQIFHGVGLAKVVWNTQTHTIAAERIMRDEILFKADEPAFGTFCSVLDMGYFYLWGRLGEDAYLARVKKYEPQRRDAYEYWDGYGFTGDINTVAPVFSGYTSGTVMRSKIFGHLYKWVFIGGTKTNRPVVTIGVARNISGPYLMSGLLQPEEMHPSLRNVHSVYAHQWAFEEETGQLMVSWNESSTGDVIGVMFKFAMLHQGAFWKDISFTYMPSVLSSLAMGHSELIKSTALAKSALCEVQHDAAGRTVIKIFAPEEAAVDAAVETICGLIRGWCNELLGNTETSTKPRGLLRTMLRLRKPSGDGQSSRQ